MRRAAENPARVVIIGAGFAGLQAARTFFRSGVRVTLVDRNNYHTFLPLLYQVGAAEIEPEQIAYPVRSFIRRQRNMDFLRAEVSSMDLEGGYILCNGMRLPYDYLVISSGSVTNFYGVDGAEANSFRLKTLDDAMVLRNHILSCFERSTYADDHDYRKALLNFVVIGGGPTGVEFSGALAELINGPLRKDFPGMNRDEIGIHLVEYADRVLPVFNSKSSDFAAGKLLRLGVDLHFGKNVVEVAGGGVRLSDGTFIRSETVVWSAGVSGFAAGGAELKKGPAGRLEVLPTLQVPGYPRVYAAGDLSFAANDGKPLPMVAPVAVQQGVHAAVNILRDIRGLSQLDFRFRDRGTMATIGRNAAVVKFGRTEIRGFFAWIVWLLVHIMYLIGFKNKVFVMFNWFWDYIFFERSVRLILPGCCSSPRRPGCLRRVTGCGE